MKGVWFLAATGLMAASAGAGDWPRWRGPGNDGNVPAGEPVPASLPAAPRVVWRRPVGAGLGSPAVAAGRVFLLEARGGRETLTAFEAQDGREVWNVDLDETIRDGQGEPGPRGTPTVEGDLVYAQSCRGELRGVSAADGRLAWRANFLKDFGAKFHGNEGDSSGAARYGYTGAPLAEGDWLYACAGGTEGASVVCFDRRNGKVRWKSGRDPAGYASPVLADLAGERQLVAFTAEALVGFRAADGAERWRAPVRTGNGRHVTTPVVTGDLVVVSSHQAGLLGVRVARAGDACRATLAWSNKTAAINYASPVAVGGRLYGLGPAQRLQCVDLATGERAWSQERFSGAPLSRDYVSLLVLGPNVLALADNGRLVLFAADPSGFRPVGEPVPACGPTRAHPAYAGGVLYLRDEKELMALECVHP